MQQKEKLMNYAGVDLDPDAVEVVTVISAAVHATHTEHFFTLWMKSGREIRFSFYNPKEAEIQREKLVNRINSHFIVER